MKEVDRHQAGMAGTEKQRSDIEALFRAFAPNKAERWCSLLSMAPKRWGDISPIDDWPLDSEFDSRPDLPLEELLSTRPLAAHLNSEVIVMRCGHSNNPGISALPLRDVFPRNQLDYDILFEGFVSILPGKLALALNHEGGLCLLEA